MSYVTYTDLDGYYRFEKKHFSVRLARASFAVYMFFILFGTSIPFGESIRDVNQIATSNIVNQVVFTTLIITSFVSILFKLEQAVLVFRTEKALILIMAWCTASVFWSDYSFISIKRLIQIFTCVSVSTSFLLNIDSFDDIINYLKPLLYAYLLVSLISILLIPGAVDPDYGQWRGLSKNKNHFGQTCLLSSIIWYISMRTPSTRYKPLAFLMMVLSIVLILGSQSMTSILTTLVFFSLIIVLMINNHFEKFRLKNIFIIYSLFFFFINAATLYLLFPSVLEEIFASMGKDLTFTGRLELWREVFEEACRHPISGTGFGAYWVMGNPKLISIYNQFIWIPRQAHMGYLDIFNEIGLVGISLFLLMVARYYIYFLSSEHNLMQYFVISALIINFQESTILRTNIPSGVFFILAYLALFFQKTGLIHQVHDYRRY